MVDEGIKVWLRCGYNYSDFWEYTFADISIVLENYKYIVEQENRRIYNQAYLTAIFVASLFNGKSCPSYDEIFRAEDISANLALLKERWIDYAEEWNKKRKGGE